MTQRTKLLVAGVVAILLFALVPYARQAWRERQLRAEEAQRAVYIELKEREIACLERLAASGLPKGMDVEREIDRCRRMAVDPATGEIVKEPGSVSGP